MNPHKLLSTFVLVGLLVACRSIDEPGSSDRSGDEQEGVVQLDPQLPTGVHLQAALELPNKLDGVPTVHDELRYLVYLPDNYEDNPNHDWPLILFLHGSGDEEYASSFVLSFGLPAVLLAGEQPKEFPFIVVSPQAFPGETWWSPEMIRAIETLLNEVAVIYRVDTDRVYLTGLGSGGYGSWWLATAYPEWFAAMASISGSGFGSPLDPEPETLCRLMNVPVWAIHGAQDKISDAQASEHSALALQQECSADVKWTLYEDLGHIDTYERTYRDPALYEWLLDHSK